MWHYWGMIEGKDNFLLSTTRQNREKLLITNGKHYLAAINNIDFTEKIIWRRLVRVRLCVCVLLLVKSLAAQQEHVVAHPNQKVRCRSAGIIAIYSDTVER
jgi:hypothetical protein